MPLKKIRLAVACVLFLCPLWIAGPALADPFHILATENQVLLPYTWGYDTTTSLAKLQDESFKDPYIIS